MFGIINFIWKFESISQNYVLKAFYLREKIYRVCFTLCVYVECNSHFYLYFLNVSPHNLHKIFLCC